MKESFSKINNSKEKNLSIELGKVDARGNERKNCMAEIEFGIEYKDGKKVFSASMEIWNPAHTDCDRCGQCLDSFFEQGLHKQLSAENEKVFLKIKDWWERYHLNELNAGTIEQDKCLKEHSDEMGKEYDYKKACEILKKYNMYDVPVSSFKPFESTKSGIVEINGESFYRYGHGLVCRAIPESVLKEIESFIDNYPNVE